MLIDCEKAVSCWLIVFSKKNVPCYWCDIFFKL